MFRALTCPSSGGQIVLSQYLVSSLSVQPFTRPSVMLLFQLSSFYVGVSLWWLTDFRKHQFPPPKSEGLPKNTHVPTTQPILFSRNRETFKICNGIRVIKTKLMHYLSSVYFFNQPLHVSGIFVAHHQEVYCICTTICTCCAFSWLLARLANRQSTDDGLQICPKHVEVDWSNELRINSTSSWASLHGCIEMQVNKT